MPKFRNATTQHAADGQLEKPRGMSQERSVERRSKITQAAIEVIASHGIAGLTHRLVAAQAGVSLAATTYYFGTKHDIISVASGLTLQSYVESFGRAANRIRVEKTDPQTFTRFVHRLIRNAVHRERVGTICWAEIILDAHRHPESLALARRWFSELDSHWQDIAKAARMSEPVAIARSAIDLTIGLAFMTLALGLNEKQVDAVLANGNDPLHRWGGFKAADLEDEPIRRLTVKSAETRERILAATVDLLISAGPGAVTYRNIAAKAGLTAAAPVYHFSTVAAVLSAAQQRLFEQSKERYRLTVPADPHPRSTNLEQLVDRTATIFLREATQFAGRNLATYAIWIESARNSALRPMVWSAISDQQLAWQRVLARVMPRQRPLDTLVAQAGFIGKILRVLATGSATDDLAAVRSEFDYDLVALSKGRFWL